MHSLTSPGISSKARARPSGGLLSAAYYAAFHVARDLMVQAGFAVPRSDGAHAYLWRRLSNGGQPDIRQAGIKLNILRGIRNQADYELDHPFSQTIAVVQVQTGADITSC